MTEELVAPLPLWDWRHNTARAKAESALYPRCVVHLRPVGDDKIADGQQFANSVHLRARRVPMLPTRTMIGGKSTSCVVGHLVLLQALHD